MGIEPTWEPLSGPHDGFEDHGRHQPPIIPGDQAIPAGMGMSTDSTRACRARTVTVRVGRAPRLGARVSEVLRLTAPELVEGGRDRFIRVIGKGDPSG